MKTAQLTLILLFILARPMFSQDVIEFRTITEAYDWASITELEDREEIKKIIFTDSIQGDDYNPETSEWYWFRYLYELFPNIEEVEVLTDQDIPDHEGGVYIDGGFFTGALWLKYFSAPFIKYIGRSAFEHCQKLEAINMPIVEIIGHKAFYYCISLLKVDFPNVTKIMYGAFMYCRKLEAINMPEVTEIGVAAFSDCSSLVAVNFPVVTSIGEFSFTDCEKLTTVSLGTGFTESTMIIMLIDAFKRKFLGFRGDHLTPNINLTLGEYVLPKANLLNNTWYDDNGDGTGNDYIWRSINVVDIQEDDGIKDIFYIGNNIYYINGIQKMELYDMTSRKIRTFNDTKILYLNDFKSGIYFLTYFKNNKLKFEKIFILN